MANIMYSNPKLLDTTGETSELNDFSLRLLQWVANNADISDNSNLIMTINRLALEATVQMDAGAAGFGPNAVVWQIGPFSPGIHITSFRLDTLSAGQVHVWIN